MPVATIYAYNPDISERASLERCALFFAPGSVDPASARNLHTATGNSKTRVHKLWPDGSVRLAYIDVYKQAWAVGLSTLEVDVDVGGEPDHDGGDRANKIITALAITLASPGGIYMGSTRLNIEGGTREFVNDWATSVRRAVRVYGKDQGYRYEIIAKLWTPISTTELEQDEVDLRACDITIRVDWNDRSTVALEKLVPAVAIKYVDANVDAVSWNFADQRVLSSASSLGVTTVTLTAEHLWNDGQGLEISGRMQWGDNNGNSLVGRPIDLLQEDLMLTGGLGNVGSIPRAARDTEDRDAMISLWEGRLAGLATVAAADAGVKKYVSWEPGFFQPTYLGQAGDHFGFGLMGPGGIYWNAPNVIAAMRWSHEQERHRPIWFSNDNGAGCTFSDSLKTHWFNERPFHTGDCRGKPQVADTDQVPKIDSPYRLGYTTVGGGIWFGADLQHAEDYTLTVYPMITGDEAAVLAFQDRMDRWAGTLRMDSGNGFIDGPLLHRAVRALRELVRAYDFAPQNTHWRKIIEQRIESYRVIRASHGQSGEAVVPAQLYPPANWPTAIPDRVSWSPYGESLIAECMLLAGIVLGSADALYLAAGISQNLIKHGWQLRDEGESQWWQIATSLDYADGVDIDEQSLTPGHTDTDPQTTNEEGFQVHWADGTGYALWCYGAAACAWNTLIQLGLVQESARTELSEQLQKAGEIMLSVQKGYPAFFQDPSEILEQQPRLLDTPIAVRENNAEFTGIELLPPPAWSSFRPADAESGEDLAPGTSTDVDLNPVADAGADDDTPEAATLVPLDGTGSYDPNGGELTSAWVQTSGTTVGSIADDDTAEATFTAPAFVGGAGDTLVFTLTVTDVNGKESTDTVTYTVTEVP